jgi:hypothetical protein
MSSEICWAGFGHITNALLQRKEIERQLAGLLNASLTSQSKATDHETRLLCVRGREGDSPEIADLVVLIDKLDCVSRYALDSSQLGDDTGGNLSATTVSHQNDRANPQLAIQLDRSSMPIQVGCST